jgi:hypothetical protein
MNNSFFISYSQYDKNIVHKVANALEIKKFKIWIDRDKKQVESDKEKKINQYIKSSKVFICFISENYCKSEACKKELDLAFRNKNNIFPIMLVQNATGGVEHIITNSTHTSITIFNAYEDEMKFEPWSQRLFNNLVEKLTTLLRTVRIHIKN